VAQTGVSKLFDLAKLKKLGGLKEDAGNILSVDPQLYEKLLIHASKTIKHDSPTKNAVLLTGISAFGPNPINLFLKGKSGIGKTYGAMEIIKYFPKENVMLLGGISPKAIVHSYGVLIDEADNEIGLEDAPGKEGTKEERQAWRRKLGNARYLVDLRGKILVFLEAPHLDTFSVLRPILSHDNFEISFKTVDTKSGLKTKHVVLRGWPATIFCTTSEQYLEDLATRSLTITPETDFGKYKDGVRLIGEIKALPAKFDLNRDFDYTLICGFICSLSMQFSNYKVIIPYGRELAEKYPTRFARSMRDFKHFCALIKATAMFHFCQRPVLIIEEQRPVASKTKDVQHDYVTDKSQRILASLEDLYLVEKLWKTIQETTETGLPGHILEFFHKAVKPLCKEFSVSYKELTVKYNEMTAEKKSSSTIRKWCRYLSDIGWVDVEKNPSDKRTYLVRNIRNAKNLGNSVLNISTGFFSQESFQKWLDDTKKYTRTTTAKYTIKQSLLDEELSSIDAVHKAHFSAHIFQEPSKPNLEPLTENKPFNLYCTEKHRISKKKLEDFKSHHWREKPQGLKLECSICSSECDDRFVGSTFKGEDLPLCESCYHQLEAQRKEA